MKSRELAHSYQRSLIYVALEACSAIFFLPGYAGGQFGGERDEWRKRVAEFIELNLLAGVLEIREESAGVLKECDVDEVRDIFRGSDPSVNAGLWMGVEFEGTRRLDDLLNVYGLRAWTAFNEPLNDKFFSELMRIYGFRDFG